MSEMKETINVSHGASGQSRSQTGAPQTGAPRRARSSTPPYNPGLQQLVDGKQTWAVPLDEAAQAKGFLGWHQRGYLPHYDAPDVTQIVTLRLVDSLPASRRGEWEHWLRIENGGENSSDGAPTCSRLIGSNQTQSRTPTGAPLKGSASGRDAGRARRRLEEYLDRGLGECWLRQPAIAKLTEGALRFFDGQRYGLAAWMVMPNHVHLLVDVWKTPLSELVKSWKSFVAREANKLLGRSGGFWEREYLDTVIEDEAHRQTAVRYIENNPVKAGLVLDARDWPWSSARFRDEFGRMTGSADVLSALGAGETAMCRAKENTNLSGNAGDQSRSQTGAPQTGAPAGLRSDERVHAS
jgi:REP element-mobilizing transposase RayT